MSGIWITSRQVEIYMRSRKEGLTQKISSAKAGISERSGRDIEKNRLRASSSKLRNWRTRTDPFEKVWESELEPMLEKEPGLSALTLLEYLQEQHGLSEYSDDRLRTLQRRVKHWRHTKGPAQEIYFRQEKIPGHLGLSDFTHLKGITVTVNGSVLEHLLYHFRLQYSGWSHMEVVLGGESHAALTHGLQNALWKLGGSPNEHRTDSLSAAFRNVHQDTQADQTKAYEAFCRHYHMVPSRNNRGCGHENGGIESPHGHLKRRIRQAFLLRGSYDFESVDAYRKWISEVADSHNRRNAKNVEVERTALRPLPAHKTADYTVLPARVSSSGTIQIRTSLYTVPSRLKGCSLQVHLYDDHLECFLCGEKVAHLQRVYGSGRLRRARNIDYRHVIESLIKKPMAFYRSQLRDALLPDENWRRIWADLSQQQPAREASRLMVGLLDLAAKTQREQAIGEYCLALVLDGKLPDLISLRKQFHYPQKEVIREIEIRQHELSLYNQFIVNSREVHYGLC